ncbi:MAG: MBOAT family O-acyltransferase [Planctomycetota bacterium]
MVFSAPTFLFLFLPGVLLAYLLGPRALRAPLLLAASLGFYIWGEQAVVAVLVASSLAGWLGTAWILRLPDPRARRRRVALVSALVLAPLVWFKYAGWLVDEAARLTGGQAWMPAPEIALPIGISFFTFQILSYVFDAARDVVPRERRFDRFLLYVSLFPQLVAGPIVRYRDVLADLADRRVRWLDVEQGLGRFCIGLIKKVLIADALARPADELFAFDPGHLGAGAAWYGLVCYSLQIYFDFSGYSDMAIGLGRVFGFRFPENFRHPYTARSVTEFWRRWHISLSSWFRDYVYIPLGGNRRGPARTAVHLWAVFLLCGVWHGAAWNFVLWGAWHGLALVVERRLGLGADGPWRARHLLSLAVTLWVVMVGWVLFRAPDLAHAAAYLERLFVPGPGDPVTVPASHFYTPVQLPALALALLCVAPLWRTALAALEGRVHSAAPACLLHAARVSLLGLLVGCAILQTAAASYSPFIYFRF